jgi:hypothetical protein
MQAGLAAIPFRIARDKRPIGEDILLSLLWRDLRDMFFPHLFKKETHMITILVLAACWIGGAGLGVAS